MNIVIFSSSHPYKMAGLVAKDMLDIFRQQSVGNVKLIVKPWGKYKDVDIISIDSFFDYWFQKVNLKAKNIISRLNKKNEGYLNSEYYIHQFDHTREYYSTENMLKNISFLPDAIIVLFMPKFLNYKNLYELNRITKAPILIYMMDMAPITGGCHYAWDCKKYTKKCGNCPGLFSNNPNDQTHINWKFKKKYIEKTNIVPIAGTEWQFRQLNESSLFENKKKYKILLSVDKEKFKPSNKLESRRELDIPLFKKIIFFGAVTVNTKRKGFKELIEALCILKNNLTEKEIKNIHLMIAGNCDPDFENSLNMEHSILGYLSHTQLVTAYQAADVYVSPSIEDSGPMMINQSIMCGTPVVAFEIGVALDLVITGITGYRATLKDSADLANGIKNILELSETKYKKMSEDCRALGLELCHPMQQSGKFIEILKNETEH